MCYKQWLFFWTCTSNYIAPHEWVFDIIHSWLFRKAGRHARVLETEQLNLCLWHKFWIFIKPSSVNQYYKLTPTNKCLHTKAKNKAYSYYFMFFENYFCTSQIIKTYLLTKQVFGTSVSVLLDCLMALHPGFCTSPFVLTFPRPYLWLWNYFF